MEPSKTRKHKSASKVFEGSHADLEYVNHTELDDLDLHGIGAQFSNGDDDVTLSETFDNIIDVSW